MELIIRDGIYEWLVHLLAPITTPVSFKKLMNSIINNIIAKSLLVYLDDLL